MKLEHRNDQILINPLLENVNLDSTLYMHSFEKM